VNPAQIRAARLARNWSQGKLAARLGVSWVTVCRWENGHWRPSPLAVARLAEVLGLVPAAAGKG